MGPREPFAKRDRINDMIRISPLRVIGPNNEQYGVIPLDEAKRLAYEQGLDLVEVSPEARPPVCKIMDYGRYKYEQSKKDKKSAGGSKKTDLKEVRLGRSLKIDPHDVAMRVQQARGFILEGHKVQFIQPMRGREVQYREQGLARMKDIEQRFADIAKVEVPPKFTGKMIIMILTGDRTKIQAYQKKEAAAKGKEAGAAAEAPNAANDGVAAKSRPAPLATERPAAAEPVATGRST